MSEERRNMFSLVEMSAELEKRKKEEKGTKQRPRHNHNLKEWPTTMAYHTREVVRKREEERHKSTEKQ